MTDYKIVKIFNEGLVGVSSTFGRQLFSSRTARKKTKCADCGRDIEKGGKCWGEVSSCAANRMHRVCDLCMEQ